MQNLGVLLAVAILALVAWLSSDIVLRSDSEVTARAESPASSALDAEIEREIADYLIAAYETGRNVNEDPHLWDLMRQLQPDQTVVLN